METNIEWLVAYLLEHTQIITVIMVLSIAALFVCLIITCWVFAYLPANYFCDSHKRPSMWQTRHWLVRSLLILTKNLVGGALLFLGVVLLFMPGQGLLTIFVGILLLDFPGKYALECRMVRLHGLRRAIDYLRQQAKQPAFLLDSDTGLDGKR